MSTDFAIIFLMVSNTLAWVFLAAAHHRIDNLRWELRTRR